MTCLGSRARAAVAQKPHFVVVSPAMANTSSAKKANRASIRKGVLNARRKKAMKEGVKGANKLFATKKTSEAVKDLPKVQQAIDKAAKRGIIKKNTASRMKSRLARLAAAK